LDPHEILPPPEAFQEGNNRSIDGRDSKRKAGIERIFASIDLLPLFLAVGVGESRS